MKSLSSSPDRGNFQRSNTAKRESDPKKRAEWEDFFKTIRDSKVESESNPEWHKNNMEADMRSCDWMVEKARSSNVYSQNLYAAMCNRDFQKIDVVEILKDSTWSCSWRYAGGIVADMRGEGDYIDWYCSGIRGESREIPEDATPEIRARYLEAQQYVGEGHVTQEIHDDLQKLGWRVLPDKILD
jgi:hypothetical protein